MLTATLVLSENIKKLTEIIKFYPKAAISIRRPKEAGAPMTEVERCFGRMTPERYGFSGPAVSPLFEVPMQVKRATHLLDR